MTVPQSIRDADLIRLIGSSDQAQARSALADLYARHAVDVLCYLRRFLPNGDEAEDILQETFLALARRAQGFQGESARPWLLTLAGNRARNLLRDKARSTNLNEGYQAERLKREHEPADPDLAFALERLAKNDARLAHVIELRFLQGLAHDEVAGLLGVSLRTAKSRAADAIVELRRLLQTASSAHRVKPSADQS